MSQATISKVYLYGDAGPAVQEKVAKPFGISVQELSGMKPSDETMCSCTPASGRVSTLIAPAGDSDRTRNAA